MTEERQGRPDKARKAEKDGAQNNQETDWVARLADEVVEDVTRRRGSLEGYTVTCASGLSPSGPIHLGNLREVMVPHLVADELKRRGIDCEHIISWDDYDRFRKVPFGVPGVDDSWSEHIGKPLTSVPAPPGSEHDSWAAHFRAAMESSLAELGVEYRGISQTEQYTSGVYRDRVLQAMEKRAEIAAVLEQYRTKPSAEAGDASAEDVPDAAEAAQAEGSGAAGEDDGTADGGEYFPFRPYSSAFGTDATRVISYDPETTEVTYVATGPDGDEVEESMRLDSDFRGKLVWKVDWPMRWAHEGVDFEPSGVDHQSPGSSWVVGEQLAPIFGAERPVGPMYAFVGIAGMAKMSSSKGGVPTPADALAIMEPHVLRWLYARRRPNQSFTVAFNNEIHRLYDEWDALERKVSGGKGQPGDNAMYARSVRTATRELERTGVPVAYRAICSVVDITGGSAEQAVRILSSMDERITDLDVARPRYDLAANWVNTQADPGDRTVVRSVKDAATLFTANKHQLESLDLLATDLEKDWTLDGLTTLVYGIPKRQAGFDVAEKKLPPEVKADQRAFFALLYRLLLGSDTGPRIPTLLLCIGPKKVRELIGR
ncbi:lysyl-tRNA synthetase, class I [Austwickia chelonae]|uniref:Lysine--tRNA ligase n=1 Tax=Austwickia chelonae NBRC 105200 TaxID=1184607 RepID=K6WAU9_9MICO|nr:lysine--tRNA ligase [Austwickia chelonae]GAB78972.1 lysyl-tRNA synthetase [Austwickia chelonae NBRC 105200]SEV87578.1 lysyl-tRNA synthetase, class I [Austwickia chelonae]